MPYTAAPRLPEDEVNRYGYRLRKLSDAERAEHPGCRWALHDHYAPAGHSNHRIRCDPRVKYFGARAHAEIYAQVGADLHRRYLDNWKGPSR